MTRTSSLRATEHFPKRNLWRVNAGVAAALMLVFATAGQSNAEQSFRNKTLNDLCCDYGRFMPEGAGPETINEAKFKALANRVPMLLFGYPRDGMDQRASTKECKRHFMWCNTESSTERMASRFLPRYRGQLGPGLFAGKVFRHGLIYAPDNLTDAEIDYVCFLDQLNPPSGRLTQCRARERALP